MNILFLYKVPETTHICVVSVVSFTLHKLLKKRSDFPDRRARSPRLFYFFFRARQLLFEKPALSVSLSSSVSRTSIRFLSCLLAPEGGSKREPERFRLLTTEGHARDRCDGMRSCLPCLQRDLCLLNGCACSPEAQTMRRS